MHEIILKFKTRFISNIWLIIAAFIAGCFITGFFIFILRPVSIGELDRRYDSQYRGATEIIGRLEAELDRERQLNSKLRDNNTRARELTSELTGSVERNVRNLQDAVSIIGEIRTKLQVL
ncbi:MAG: hypothetical protein FWD13_01835, partial [Treponema sp.]|nr:hypothetical protein [Treponema sp.]